MLIEQFLHDWYDENSKYPTERDQHNCQGSMQPSQNIHGATRVQLIFVVIFMMFVLLMMVVMIIFLLVMRMEDSLDVVGSICWYWGDSLAFYGQN